MKIELGRRLAPYAKEFVEWLILEFLQLLIRIVELVEKTRIATRALSCSNEIHSM